MANNDDPAERFKLDYASPASRQPAPLPDVLLESMPLNEAELARLKLESEGIHCSIVGQSINTMYPLLFSSVELRVNPSDRDRARQILDTPADDTMEGEYVEEPWRCPKCHRKALELLPAAGLRKIAWYGFWALAALIALNIVMELATAGDAHTQQAWNADAGWARIPAVLAFAGVCLYLIIGPRQKLCPKCGWRSSRPDSAE